MALSSGTYRQYLEHQKHLTSFLKEHRVWTSAFDTLADQYRDYFEIAVLHAPSEKLIAFLSDVFGRFVVRLTTVNEEERKEILHHVKIAANQTYNLERPLKNKRPRKVAITPVILTLLEDSGYPASQLDIYKKSLLECLQASQKEHVYHEIDSTVAEYVANPADVHPEVIPENAGWWGDAIRSFGIDEELRVRSAYSERATTFQKYETNEKSVRLAIEWLLGLYIVCLQRDPALAHVFRERMWSLQTSRNRVYHKGWEFYMRSHMKTLMDVLHFFALTTYDMVYNKNMDNRAMFSDRIDDLCTAYFSLLYGTTPNPAVYNMELFTELKLLPFTLTTSDFIVGAEDEELHEGSNTDTWEPQYKRIISKFPD